MAGQRLRIPKIDKARHKLESIMEFNRSFKAAFEPHSHQRTGASTKILLRERIVRTGWKSGIVDPINPVSYTHLDVYKRQDQSCTLPRKSSYGTTTFDTEGYTVPHFSEQEAGWTARRFEVAHHGIRQRWERQ